MQERSSPADLLHILIGPPGGGKSTYAHATFPADWIVSADDIRERVTKWRRDDPVATWKYVVPLKAEFRRALSLAVGERLRARLPTVYDNTNVLKHNRESVLRLVPPEVGVRYVVLDRPLAAKLADRGWRPESLVRKQHELFLAELPDILAGDGRPFVTVEDRRQATTIAR
jgi:predicted kinase